MHGKRGHRCSQTPPERLHLWAGGGASPTTPASPTTALTLEGRQPACDAKTKDLHSPELGQTLPKPLACCPVEGAQSAWYQENKTERHILNTALPKQKAGCSNFSICSREASRNAAFAGDRRTGFPPGALLEWPGLTGRGSPSFLSRWLVCATKCRDEGTTAPRSGSAQPQRGERQERARQAVNPQEETLP